MARCRTTRRRLTPEDRWAIVAYIRALQLSQNAKPGGCAGGRRRFEPLAAIAEKQGLPASFAEEWTLPPTAVTALRTAGQCDSAARPGATGTTNGAATPAHAGCNDSVRDVRTNCTEAVTSEASERRLETNGIWTRTNGAAAGTTLTMAAHAACLAAAPPMCLLRGGRALLIVFAVATSLLSLLCVDA